MLFVVEKKDKREQYIEQGLIKNGYLTASFYEASFFIGHTKIYLKSISCVLDKEAILNIESDSVVFARDISADAAKLLSAKNIKYYDYNADEAFLVKNAELTAEGALSYLITNTEDSLNDIKALVLGYGRVGKAVTASLKRNNVSVCVATSDATEYALAQDVADKVFNLDNYTDELKNFTAIINTIPAKILKGEILSLINKECFILDLASKPGGVDYEYAAQLGLNVLHALGVPGSVAPKAAASYIMESIVKSLNIKYEG
ncbi:MAG: hypothetical protein EOM87_02275 [Clostridia bacterium]|nr:hypothetical protein [Clostridia bacterium]